MKYLVSLTVLVVVGLIASLMLRLGSFKEVKLTEGERGPYKQVFKKHVGGYHRIVPVLEEVEKWVKANGEPCLLTFGEFIDDPDVVIEDRLRSTAGCFVEKKWDLVLPAGFGYREIPVYRYVIAEFDGAPSIGPIKVYPRAKDYIAAHNLKQVGPTYEIYEILSPERVKTTYLFPVAAK